MVRYTLKAAGLRPYHRPRKPRLTAQQKQERLVWAKKYQHLSSVNIVHVDEKHWKPYAPGNRKNDVVWAHSPEQVPAMEVVAQGPEFHTVGAMSRHGVFALQFYEGSMTAVKYQEIVAKAIIPEMKRRFGDEAAVLMHDRASSHTASSTHGMLQRELPEGSSFVEFPARSPDLNSVDTLWAQVMAKVQARMFSTMQGFKKIIREEWNKVKDETCQKLMDGFRNRVKAVVKAGGAHTIY
jgi:hypothetical protein